jgi:hypothetical protein
VGKYPQDSCLDTLSSGDLELAQYGYLSSLERNFLPWYSHHALRDLYKDRWWGIYCEEEEKFNDTDSLLNEGWKYQSSDGRLISRETRILYNFFHSEKSVIYSGNRAKNLFQLLQS